MLIVETIARIRREHFIKGKTIKEIARDLKVSRNTVRKVLRSGETSFEYERVVQPRPKLGRWAAELDGLLSGNAGKSAREQLTLIRIFEELRGRGYDGGYDAVRRYARRWSKERGESTAAAYVPLSFAPGEAYQFDWSHEVVLLNGVTVIVKAAHVRLCHSRMLFVRCYPRETQEMVFDAHDRAFALFKGTCVRGIYDNMKTAVETIFVGKGRLYNRRFMQMCSHYLVVPVACTPASGWEKGQVENQVGLVRERFFTPRLRFKNYDELNAWLLDKCIAYAKAHRHPELTEQTVWEVFEAERPKLVPYAGRFDGFHSVPASVSKTCLVRFDNSKYSVAASAAGQQPGGCVAGLESLKGSLVQHVIEEGSAIWRFKHPTVGDAYAGLLLKNPELLGIFVHGSSLEKLLGQITCGDVGLERAVIVPKTLFDLVLKRLDQASDTKRYKTPALANWYSRSRIDDFLALRCSREFLVQYIAGPPDVLARVSDPGLFLDSVSEVGLAIRLHEFGLLPEEYRKAFVARVVAYALDGEDLHAIESARIQSVFTEEEREDFRGRIRSKLVPNLGDVRWNWQSNCNSDQRADEYLQPLLDWFSSLKEKCADDSNLVALIDREIALGRDWIAERLADDPRNERFERTFGDVEVMTEPPLTARSIFDDVDE